MWQQNPDNRNKKKPQDGSVPKEDHYSWLKTTKKESPPETSAKSEKSESSNMFDILKNVSWVTKQKDVSIDNAVFKLHYKATFSVLVFASLIVTAKQYIGDPIDCVTTDIPNKVMDTYCWIHSTFSVSTKIGNVPYHGVAPVSGNEDKDDIEFTYHKYYQWVCYMLFFQALLFYMPKYIWKNLESGRVKMVLQDLHTPVIDPEVRNKRIKVIVDYFEINRNSHRFYALKFLGCELLNFINVVGQIYFTNLFLGGQFTTYGREVLSISESKPELRHDAASRVFPIVTKCTFHKYGSSGSIETFDSLCVLPLNIVNEKIYIFMYFWFILVAFITGIHLVIRLVTIALPQFRGQLMKILSSMKLEKDVFDNISQKLDMGDWFMFYQVTKNMDPVIFGDTLVAMNNYLTETFPR